MRTFLLLDAEDDDDDDDDGNRREDGEWWVVVNLADDVHDNTTERIYLFVSVLWRVEIYPVAR